MSRKRCPFLWIPRGNTKIKFKKKNFMGHNFWLERPLDLRSMFLSCIFDALFCICPNAHMPIFGWDRSPNRKRLLNHWNNHHFATSTTPNTTCLACPGRGRRGRRIRRRCRKPSATSSLTQVAWLVAASTNKKNQLVVGWQTSIWQQIFDSFLYCTQP